MNAEQLIPEQRVLMAAINLAIFDSCKQPIIAGDLLTKSKKHKDYKLHTDARTAFQFIFGEGLENFCNWLPLDSGWLRKKLLDYMFDDGPKKPTAKDVVVRVDDQQRRMFRINYKLYKLEREACWTSLEEESQELPIKQVISRLDQKGRVLEVDTSGRRLSGKQKFHLINSGSKTSTSTNPSQNGPGTADGQASSE
jgi:hypothetical protein